jgi:hypothetical protein
MVVTTNIGINIGLFKVITIKKIHYNVFLQVIMSKKINIGFQNGDTV